MCAKRFVSSSRLAGYVRIYLPCSMYAMPYSNGLTAATECHALTAKEAFRVRAKIELRIIRDAALVVATIIVCS